MNEQRTHILVVEDQGAHAELMRHAFASHTDRFRLTVVGSLQGARNCLEQKNRPDLVITDLLLPDGKGIELLPKDEPPPFPLVLMTSHGDEKAAADAIKAGALDYVLKSATTLGDMPRVAERALREWSHIVQRMHAEESLRRSQKQYRMLFDRMLDGYALHEIICDDDGRAIDYRFLDINPAFETFTGLGRDIIGQRVLKVLPLTEHHWIDIYGKVALTGEPIQFENYSQGVGGKWFQVVAFSPAERQFVTIFQEVTRRKQIEEEREALIDELEAKNAELERFVYTVSHDLKSPLITITGFLGFLERDAMAGNFERLKDDMARISNAATKMQQLLDELLELSRIGRMMNPPEQVPMGELAREAVDMIAGQLNERDVQIEISPALLQPDGPTVYGDRLRLYEVLENLVDNAVKFTSDQPDPRVEIGVRRDGDETVFYVQDNGIGIEPPYHNKVFDLFEKLDVGTRGTGVGLAIVKRIVEVHGGRVWVESQGAGQGSTFCFTLADKK